MSALCRFCGKVIPNKRNSGFYCDECAKVWRDKGAKCYQLGSDKHNAVWVRGNQIVKAVINGKLVEPFYVRKEVVE